MTHVVAKEFKTVNRVMRVGTLTGPEDHIEPHDFAIMKERGFIKEAVPEVMQEETKPRSDEELAQTSGAEAQSS